ncbi:MAG: oxidoreductase [Chloroflexi bacterium]|nr:oxidoreductase [Chloroflexota bacterium]
MWEFESQVEGIIQRTPTIKSFRFPIRAKNVRYRAGQFFWVTIKLNGEEGIHHFSFSSSPTEKGYLEFTKRITQSAYSQALAGMEAGAWARLEGPSGEFTLPRKPMKIAFLTGGIGITPQRSMLRYVADKNLPFDVVLLYGNSTGEEICFRQELEALAREVPSFRVEHILTSPPPGWTGHTGFINADLVQKLIPDYRERLFYLSGPPRMVLALQNQLSSLEIPDSQVRRDSFTGYD